MAKQILSIWNDTSRNGNWYGFLGKQGIYYEYLLPYGANPNYYYQKAIDVRSRKGSNNRPSTKDGVRRQPGAYQPVGDKRHFTFYRLRKMQMNKKQYQRYLAQIWAQEKFERFKKYLDRNGY